LSVFADSLKTAILLSTTLLYFTERNAVKAVSCEVCFAAVDVVEQSSNGDAAAVTVTVSLSKQLHYSKQLTLY